MNDRPVWLTGSAFDCAVQQRASRCEIRLEGELDLSARPALDQALATVLTTRELDDVSVDLGAVSFADSSVIAWLLGADRRIRRAGGHMSLVACSPVMRDLLRLTGVDDRLALVDRGSMR